MRRALADDADDGPVGGGETGRSTAHLSNAIDVYYQTIARLHGPTGARLAAESHTAAVAEIAAIVERERISCDFETVHGLWGVRGEVAVFPDDEMKSIRAGRGVPGHGIEGGAGVVLTALG